MYRAVLWAGSAGLLLLLQGGAMPAWAQQDRDVVLPPPRSGPHSLEEALRTRRSVRSFAGEPLDQGTIGQLLWAAQGVTSPSGQRTAPSAGALYPLELYVMSADGVARYDPARHRLHRHLADDVRWRLESAALGQDAVGEAPLVVVIAAVPARTAAKYGSRTDRYVSMEAGHAAQNLLLQATALGLGAVPVGAFDDAAVARVMRLPAGQEPLYLIPVGKPRR